MRISRILHNINLKWIWPLFAIFISLSIDDKESESKSWVEKELPGIESKLSSRHTGPFWNHKHPLECLHVHLLYEVTSLVEQNFIHSECWLFSIEHIQLESSASQVGLTVGTVFDVILVLLAVVIAVVGAVWIAVVVLLVVVVVAVVVVFDIASVAETQLSWFSSFHWHLSASKYE